MFINIPQGYQRNENKNENITLSKTLKISVFFGNENLNC